jgi:hypothetical protein
MTAWSNEELGRAVASLNASVDRLTQAIADLDERFLPREVYEANRRADQAQVDRITAAAYSWRNYFILPGVSVVVSAVTTAAIIKGLHL